jgi:hypothetical protein
MGLDRVAGALNSTEASSAIRITATAVCVYLAIGAVAPLLARRAHRDAALVLGAILLLQLLAEGLVAPGLLPVADTAFLSTVLFAVVGWGSSFGHARRLRKGD